MEVVRRTRLPATVAALVAAGAVGIAHPAGMQAGDPPWLPPSCPPPVSAAPSATVGAWFSLDPVLDAGGTLVGRRLAIGDAGGTIRRLDLPPESFASGPVGGRVLVGDDDGVRSRLRLVDPGAGCAAELGEEAAVVRGAILARDGRSAWEHRVERTSRADLGVWVREVAGGGARPVLPGLAPDARYGPTFETTLDWADDGRLVAATCGVIACRVRVLDPAGGRVEQAGETGEVIGVAGDRVIARAACLGLPCPIVAVELGTGRRTTLAEGRGFAALGGARGRTLVYEAADGLAAMDAPTGRPVALPDAGGAVPVRGGSAATSGADLPPGWMLLAPGGQLSGPASGRGLDVDTATLARLPEVRR
jgi:hypothetical protein